MKKILFVMLASFILAGLAVAGHQGEIAVQECTTCHTSNLVTEHGGFASEPCWRCHDSGYVCITNTIDMGKQGEPVSCTDCHGGSCIPREPHIEQHASYMADWMNMSGVEPGAAPLWAQVTDFTGVDLSTSQYQLCFKCHSSYSFGEVPNGVTNYVGPSGTNLTDQAMEFNPANKSAHPVEATLNNQTGSYGPKGLRISQMKSPWTNVGNQKLQCSDCHEKNTDSQPDAKFLLKGPAQYWPRNGTNNELWTLYDLKENRNNWKNDLFCANCHTLSNNGKFFNEVHDKGDHNSDQYPDIDSIPNSQKYPGPPCVMCHVAVPHGCKQSRLIVYTKDVEPYNYRNTGVTERDKGFAKYHGGLMGTMTGFKKSTNPDNYDKDNCYIPENENYDGKRSPRWGCGDHEDNRMSYD